MVGRYLLAVGSAAGFAALAGACGPPGPDFEKLNPVSRPSAQCGNIETAWTGPDYDHNRFHCVQACELRNRGAIAEADYTCARLDALMKIYRDRPRNANDYCRQACPLDNYDFAEDPR